jgi:hypothetical protein
MTPRAVVGLVFVHGYWLDTDNRPIVCNVSAIRQGRIYYRMGNQTRATEFCTLDRWPMVCGANRAQSTANVPPGANETDPN